jgi:dephospho-CoA kinase
VGSTSEVDAGSSTLGQNGRVTSSADGETTPAGARRVLLTGGIGSGKSAAARLLAGWGAVVVDADVLARDVVAPGTAGLRAVVEEFGDGVLAADGSLDRAALAEVVFHDPQRLAALEAIVHPLVQRVAEGLLAAVPAGSVAVYEVPVPNRRDRRPGEWFLVVDAPDDVRRRRLLGRGLSADQVAARMARQPSRAEWLALGDRVVDNGGDLATLRDQLREVWRELTGTDPVDVHADPPVGAAD